MLTNYNPDRVLPQKGILNLTLYRLGSPGVNCGRFW